MIKERIEQFRCTNVRGRNMQGYYEFYEDNLIFYYSKVKFIEKGDFVEILKDRNHNTIMIWVNEKLELNNSDLSYYRVMEYLYKILEESFPKKELSIYWGELPDNIKTILQRVTDKEYPFEKENTSYEVVESKGFGVMEDPMEIVFTKEFETLKEAEEFLDGYRKDKNQSWASWETPYTYKIRKLNK